MVDDDKVARTHARIRTFVQLTHIRKSFIYRMRKIADRSVIIYNVNVSSEPLLAKLQK